MDTKALVTLCQKGNGQALSLLYENYSEKMLKVCLRYIPDPTIAQDLLHDGFVIIFTSIHSLRNPVKSCNVYSIWSRNEFICLLIKVFPLALPLVATQWEGITLFPVATSAESLLNVTLAKIEAVPSFKSFFLLIKNRIDTISHHLINYYFNDAKVLIIRELIKCKVLNINEI